MMRMISVLMLVILVSCQTRGNLGSSVASIGGYQLTDDHELSRYAVAVGTVRDDKFRPHCSGTIISLDRGQQIASAQVLTAGHCLEDSIYKSSELWIGFGENPSSGKTHIKVSKVTPFDWRGKKYDENGEYDMAILDIKGPIPAEVAAAQLLGDSSDLPQQATTVGYGVGIIRVNGKVEDHSGKRLALDQRVVRYFDNALFTSSFAVRKEGEPFSTRTGTTIMGGSCFGDSGGGAFVQISTKPGEVKWYLAGVAGNINGFLSSKDPSNPSELAACYHSTTLYTFAGSYLEWLKSKGANVRHSGTILPWPPSVQQEPQDFVSWCQSHAFPPEFQSAFFSIAVSVQSKVDWVKFDCGEIEKAVATVEELNGFPYAQENEAILARVLPFYRGLKVLNLTNHNLQNVPRLTSVGASEVQLGDNYISKLPSVAANTALRKVYFEQNLSA